MYSSEQELKSHYLDMILVSSKMFCASCSEQVEDGHASRKPHTSPDSLA